MQERLARVRAMSPESVSEARRALIQNLGNRRLLRGRLRPEGVEDQDVFFPGVSVEAVAVDEGHDDLARPVSRRVWFRVTYLTEERALTDEYDRPIHSLFVGVNESKDGHILKASVVGNLEFDLESISYEWVPNPGV
jgi:hypothetical protein